MWTRGSVIFRNQRIHPGATLPSSAPARGTAGLDPGFYKRRLTRLEPPYILSLLICTVTLVIRHARFRSILQPLLAQMVYVHNFTKLESVNFVTWSLEVEVQFYFLAPLLGCLYAIRSAVLRRGVMVGAVLVSMYVYTLTPYKASWNLPGHLQFFMVGFLLGDLRARSLR
jgi:peptidoglycan/LPS O-acetylase OafA/YrhL